MISRGRWRGIVVILLAVALSLAVLGCKEEQGDGFTLAKHTGNTEYVHNLDGYSVSHRGLEFFVEKEQYNLNKTQARTIADDVIKDYDALADALGTESGIVVHFVLKGEVEENGFAAGSRVYAKRNAFVGRSYLRSLISAFIGSYEPWKIEGLLGYVFENEAGEAESSEQSAQNSLNAQSEQITQSGNAQIELNKSGLNMQSTAVDLQEELNLTEYYSNPENLMTLSLFAGYFVEEYAEAETMAAARKTATELTRLTLTRSGTEAFLSAGLTEGRQELLDSLGIDAEYSLPFDTGWLSGARYSHDIDVDGLDKSFPLVIEAGNRTYYTSPIPSDAYFDKYGLMVEDFATPFGVLRELSVNIALAESCKEYIKENAPAAYPRALEKYKRHMTFYILKGDGGSHANMGGNIIVLGQLSHFVHEVTHLIGQEYGTPDKLWMQEGMADYFSWVIAPSSARARLQFDTLITQHSDPDTNLFRQLIVEEYRARGGVLTWEEFDVQLALEAQTVVSLARPDLDPALTLAEHYKKVFSGKFSKIDEELTYLQAYSFVKYLAERIGEESMLLALHGVAEVDWEKEVGMSLDEVFAEFLAAHTSVQYDSVQYDSASVRYDSAA